MYKLVPRVDARGLVLGVEGDGADKDLWGKPRYGSAALAGLMGIEA
jgi:hypothetical protein